MASIWVMMILSVFLMVDKIRKIITERLAFNLTMLKEPIKKIKPGFFFYILLGCLAIFCLKSCAWGEAKLTPLRIGINDWPGYTVVLYAKEKGIFKNRGLALELIKFNNTQDALRAVMLGAIDATFVPLWEVMQADSDEHPPVFFLVVDVSAGSDGIVAQAPIKTVEQLKGKKVGAKLATLSHLVLLEALEAHHLNPQDVIIEDYLNEVSAEEIAKGNLDGAVLWQPLLSQTAEKIKGNVIFTTKEIDSVVIDGVATRQDFRQQHPQELIQFILGWFDTIQAIEKYPDTVFSTMDKLLEQESGMFAHDYGGIKKGDRAMNEQMFLTNGRLEKAKNKIIELLHKDSRHGRRITEAVNLEPELLEQAIAQSKP